jgi:lysyl-tRNA synthetase class 2
MAVFSHNNDIMSQLIHLEKNRDQLKLRFDLLREVRRFFDSENFTEVETPLIVRLPGQEPNIVPIELTVHDDKKTAFPAFLHTSPEYTMKKLLAVGWDKIYFLGKCFRDQESFGGTHNPEFTMIEWYRARTNFESLMADCGNLTNHLIKYLDQRDYTLKNENIRRPWQKKHMRDLWREHVDVNLDDYLRREAMLELNKKLGYTPGDDESYEELFYRIFLNKIEAHLGTDAPTIVHHYPREMAALSKIDEQDPNYAERFELYINGLEIANAYSELTDPEEQKKRLEEERLEREKLGLSVFEVDPDFIDALISGLPESAGIALGVDRLFMALTACQDIDNLLVLPMSKLFE